MRQWPCTIPLMSLILGAGAALASPASDLAGYYSLPPSPLSLPVEAPPPFVLALYPCGAADLCGRIAGLGDLAEESAADFRNPVHAQRDRPLCGLQVLALHPAGGAWRGGFYDPTKGDNVAIKLQAEPDGTLRAEGYAGKPFLSRSFGFSPQHWKRITPAAATCEHGQPAS